MENYSEITSTKFVQGQSSFEYDVPNNDNYLFDCYAGAGKTHLILNDIIPKLDKKLLRPQDIDLQIADCKKFKKDTRWKPKISFNDSVKKLLNHCRQHP